MNIVFFGTSKLGIDSLENLSKSNFKIVEVITPPDKKAGRGLELKPSPIKEFALEKNIPIFQPENINSRQSIEFLKNVKADVFIVIAYGKILKKEILEIPSLGSINAHFSLLPKYRGAAPINWVIANGEDETGVTVIKMNEFMDKGDIILQEKIAIADDDDAISLADKLSKLAPKVLNESLNLLKKKSVKFVTQDEKRASYAPILKKSDGVINWHRDAKLIHNQVRAFVPWPGSFTYFGDLQIKICKTEVIQKETSCAPAEVVEINKDGILVAAKKDCILIRELQPEAKKRMAAQEFVNGHNIKPGNKLQPPITQIKK